MHADERPRPDRIALASEIIGALPRPGSRALLFERLLGAAFATLGVQRGFVVLRDAETGELERVASRNDEPQHEGEEIGASRTILDHTLETGVGQLLVDAGRDEVADGTNPCNADSDADGVPDDTDPLPTEPGLTSGFLEDECRDLANTGIPALGLGVFNGPNDNASSGRRSALANRSGEAANLIADGDYQGAIDALESLLQKIDGETPPPDWMDGSPERTALAADVELLISLREDLV